MIRSLLLSAALLFGPVAGAIDAGQRFEDPAMQARYERLIHGMRCLMCQNESVADSNALIAGDLRREVAELIVAGRSDEEIRTFMTDRYGDFVLYRPPVKPRTWLLWSAPVLFLLAGLGIVATIIVRRARAARANPAALDEEPDRP